MAIQTKTVKSYSPRELKQWTFDAKDTASVFPLLPQLGIHISQDFLSDAVTGMRLTNDGLTRAAMDAGIQTTVTSGSINVPIQFAQFFAPGFVQVNTAARKIDELIGMKIMGSWEDEEVVQGIKEVTNGAVTYGDYTDIPLTAWNNNWERRTVIRGEQGLLVANLEEQRSALIRINAASEKRTSASLALEIRRNAIGFFGFDYQNSRTFGFLNDPNLPAYVSLPLGASGHSAWAQSTFLEITAQIRLTLSTLRVQSQDLIDPKKTPITIAIPTGVIDYLSVVNVQGTQSVQQWLDMTYPNVRVVSAPQLAGANGGLDVMYVYAEKIQDESTDGGETFVQMVQSKFMALGVERLAKGYKEDYSNATAGVMCKRPYLVTRWSFS